ncbi:hypothetical protein CTN07_14905 [Photobacterium damselae]|nr:hypothetical protein CTN07_14905 [Photobacterium damselae]
MVWLSPYFPKNRFSPSNHPVFSSSRLLVFSSSRLLVFSSSRLLKILPKTNIWSNFIPLIFPKNRFSLALYHP